MNPETSEAYEDKLREVRAIIEKTKNLMESDREGVSLKAVELFIQLSDLELALVHVLCGEPGSEDEEERNPLVRRLRLDP
jgi:hypothetical protein